MSRFKKVIHGMRGRLLLCFFFFFFFFNSLFYAIDLKIGFTHSSDFLLPPLLFPPTLPSVLFLWSRLALGSIKVKRVFFQRYQKKFSASIC